MSAKVDAPPGGPWKQAWVERSSSRSPYGGRNLGSRTTTTVDLRLTGNGRDERFVLSENGEIPTDAKVEIVFAPDGHALALRKVGDPAYGYVALDAGDAPLFCPHWTFGATGDPWRGAPTTRDLAIDILSAGPASGHHAEGVTSREVIPAADYACAHREAAIMMAMVRLAREGAPLPGPDLALPCLVDAARTHAEVRDGLLAAAIGNKGTDRANARKWTARVLAQLGDERAQEALATLLSDEMAIASEHLEERWHEALPEIAHALTLVTEARRAASDPAIRIALSSLTSDACLPTPDCNTVREEAGHTIAALEGDAMAGPQETLAAALVSTLVASCEDASSPSDRRGFLAWALALTAHTRRAAPPAAVSALIAAATYERPCRGSCASDCELMRAHAILGLSELDAPDAAATLAALAKGPCDGAVDKESIDLWKRPLYVEAGNYAPACWARAVSP